MSKIVIYLTGKPRSNGYQIREFKWVESLGLYLYDGREFAPAEFNAAFDKALKTNADLHFRVKFTDTAEGDAPEAVAPTAHEVTLEEAEAVVARLAPHRLKKKTGPKAELVEMEA